MKEEIGSKNPLVTVGVLTYNSSRTVLETLDSIKAQSYRNIELVVSDDASTDNTVELCRKWISENKDRFVRCELLTVPKNTGIPANANRRLEAARGVWIKGVAADDLLAPDCVENFINYVNEHPEAEVIFAKYQRFKKEFSKENFVDISDLGAEKFCTTFKTSKAQYKRLIECLCCHPSTMFAKLELLKRVKYDERFRMIEDYPMWLRLTRSGVRFFFMREVVVFYRLSEQSTFGNLGNLKRQMLFYIRMEPFRVAYILPERSYIYRLIHHIFITELKLLHKTGLLNENNRVLNNIIFKLLYFPFIHLPLQVYKTIFRLRSNFFN